MTDVAIVFPPLRVSRDFIDYPYFADLGAVQAAAVLRAAGRSIALVDAFAIAGATLAPLDEGSAGVGDVAQRPAGGTPSGAPGFEATCDPIETKGYVRLGAPVQETLAAVPADARAILVAFTPFHRPPARDPLLADLLAGLRAARPATPIVIADLYQSGQHVVDAAPESTLAAYPEADVFVRYEAEDLLVPLFDELAARGRPEAPRAIDGGEPAPLDALPLPAWDLVDLDRYFAFHEDVVRKLGRAGWAFPIDGRSVPALTSRGCPYRCVHCSSNPTSRKDGRLVAPKTQRRYGAAYLDRLFGELRRLGARRVHLLDELVNVNERHFDAVLALLARHDLAFEVPNGMRADYILPEHFATMKGRLTTLSVSAESGVQRVIDEVVDKKLDLRAIGEAARGAAAAGIPMLVHFMIGLPDETKAEINGTLAFALDLHEETGAWPSVQYATPLPGTRLAAVGHERGRVLPLIQDFGPHFQRRPSLATHHVSLDDLERFKGAFDHRIEAARGPKRVVLPVTYKCNNRCTFCATGTRSQIDGDLDRQRALLVRLRKQGFTELDLDGGEPTLNPNLLKLVAFARRTGYEKIQITTNARLASYGDFADRLAQSGVSSILISIHGPDAETHAQNVGAPEAFEQTCAGARNLVRAAPKGVEIGAEITVTRSNHDTLAAVASLALELGLRRLDVRALVPFGPATSAIAPDTTAVAAEVMRLVDAFADRLEIRVVDLPPCFLPGYEHHVAGDVLALRRQVVYASPEGVDVFAYLRARRVRKPACAGCAHAISCAGFWEMEGAPDPGWLRGVDLLAPPRDAAGAAG